MEIILNEYKKAIEIIKTKKIDINIVQALSILARYFYHYENVKNNALYEVLDRFMSENYDGYNSLKWTKCIDRQVLNAKKHKLIEIDYIPITENEMKTITDINNKVLERLCFTMLVLAKYYNLINSKNNDWINKDLKTVFSLANISVKQVKQCQMLNTLKKIGLISTSAKVDNLNLNVQFIDNNSKEVYQIKDIRNLGNTYRMLMGESYKCCQRCNKVIKINKNTQYCKECSTQIEHEKHRKRQEKYRKNLKSDGFR